VPKLGKETTKISKELLKRTLEAEKLKYCHQCGTCTASCPVARVIPEHYNPRSLLQKVYLDLDSVLEGDELWLCAWCYTCYERCPQDMKTTEVIMLTRNLAVERGKFPERPASLIKQIVKTGRTLEVTQARDLRRASLGLPKIGETVSKRALDEIQKVAKKGFPWRLEEK